MKIKELHIRNIASITEADIDFEQDLGGAEMFLIAGDTGAGKSTLLDCISLALYKITPRVKNYAKGSYNAEYTNREGENVGIYKIEQYTRLGISAKDECYSEVVFEGNDGLDYRARLTLGLRMGNADKETGIRPIKHCTPKWEAKIGNEDWIKIGKDGEPISSAVGLSFEQFSRMAMLAQGEFAAFLTGDRKEKELILEQLTDTAIFSRYGTAISEISGKYKKQLEIAQKEVEDERSHTISQEDLDRLNNELRECRNAFCQLEQKIKDNAEILGWFSKIDNAEAERQDATVYMEQKLRPFFTTLLGDLSYRRQCLAEQEQTIYEDEVWLKNHANTSSLFERYGEVCILIDNLIKKQKDNQNAKQDRKRHEQMVETLQQEASKCHELSRQTTEISEAKQNEINNAIKERELLNPNGIADKLSKTHAILGKLTELRNEIAKINENERNIAALNDKAQKYREITEQLKVKKEVADREYEASEKEYEIVRNTLTTVKAGINEVIVNLRNKLVDSKIDICPLCGQKIDRHEIEKDFGCIVAPWVAKEQEAKARRDNAYNNQQEANSAYNKANGSYCANMELIGREEENNRKLKQRLTSEAIAIGIENSEEIAPRSEEMIKAVSEEIEKYSALQFKAEEMQRSINRLLKEKEQFDISKAEADKNCIAAQHNKEQNDLYISNVKKNIEHNETEIESIVNILTDRIGQHYPEWRQDTEKTRDTIKKDAEVYLARREKHRDEKNIYEKAKEEAKTFDEYSEQICEIHPEWKHEAEAQKYNEGNVNYLWTEFIRKTGENIGILNKSREKISEYTNKISNLCPLSVELTEYRSTLEAEKALLANQSTVMAGKIGAIINQIHTNEQNEHRLQETIKRAETAEKIFRKWECLNKHFGGTRFRTLVQTYVLRPLLNNANIYLGRITDRYKLTCSETDEQLSILVEDRYNKNQIRSVTVLSGGERFMVSLALSLALSSLNTPDMNVNILFIDEGFGTLDETTLNSVMQTLETLQEIAGQSNRRVGIISHRSELAERIPTQIVVRKCGEGRSKVEVCCS